MPYAASLRRPQQRTTRATSGTYVVHVDRLVEWLNSLADELTRAGDHAAAIEAELNTLRQQRAAIRAFVGIEAQA